MCRGFVLLMSLKAAKNMYKKLFLINLVFFFFTLSNNAYAYLDPGSGSYFFQILIAGLVGFLFVAKTFFLKVITTVKRVISKVFKLKSK